MESRGEERRRGALNIQLAEGAAIERGEKLNANRVWTYCAAGDAKVPHYVTHCVLGPVE